MSINKLVSIENAVTAAIEDMGIKAESSLRRAMKRWARIAEWRIDGFGQGIPKSKKLVLNGCSIELPEDVIALYPGVLLGDYQCDCEKLFSRFYDSFNNNNNTFFSGNYPIDSYHFAINNYEIINNTLMFPLSYTNETITIRYMGFETDCNGVVMVNQNHLEAINWFIKTQYAFRSIFSPQQSKINRGDRKDIETEWHRNVTIARSASLPDTPAQHSRLTTLINDSYSGIQERLMYLTGYENKISVYL